MIKGVSHSQNNVFSLDSTLYVGPNYQIHVFDWSLIFTQNGGEHRESWEKPALNAVWVFPHPLLQCSPNQSGLVGHAWG